MPSSRAQAGDVHRVAEALEERGAALRPRLRLVPPDLERGLPVLRRLLPREQPPRLVARPDQGRHRLLWRRRRAGQPVVERELGGLGRGARPVPGLDRLRRTQVRALLARERELVVERLAHQGVGEASRPARSGSPSPPRGAGRRPLRSRRAAARPGGHTSARARRRGTPGPARRRRRARGCTCRRGARGAARRRHARLRESPSPRWSRRP